jgi:hypothetical protein
MKQLIFFPMFFQMLMHCVAQEKSPMNTNNPGIPCDITGRLGKTLGTTLTVRGVITDNNDKGDDGPSLIVQMINDSSIQNLIKIPVSPYFGEFGDNGLPKLKHGDTYLFRAYETGAFTGIPADAWNEAGIMLQTTGFYFQNKLIVISGKKIDPIIWSPGNFLGRNALLAGIAENENGIAIIRAPMWKLRLIGSREWTGSEIGKAAEVYGKIEATETLSIFNIKDNRAQLSRLKDLLGKTVKLRGEAINSNEFWSFNYRGTNIYVEKMDELPNWSVDNHFCPMEITGILEEATLPRIDQIGVKKNRDSSVHYIIRKPSWTPVPELLTPELRY